MTGSQHFPGSVGISSLDVYESVAPDGIPGGSPHMHTVCTEAYVVTSGKGRLQTLSRQGFDEVELAPGDVSWFGPGTVHRAVNDGDLRAIVIMQNAGLPEAGDAVLTVPDDVLADAAAYRTAVDLGDGTTSERFDRARRRRDLAVTGFMSLVAAAKRGDTGPFERFLARAYAVVRERASTWPDLIASGPLDDATTAIETARAIAGGTNPPDADGSAGGFVRHLGGPASISPGMCGALRKYDTATDETRKA
ncbi:cupin domain-containing protein [Spelaeicoccus albus]|uniref:Mannose-6-phosphate isomerase-like protein (Cupin superfamily) n=1 Tax=Spelaeicoccus albus TaxID=1280376 RepID=A0A7Z0A9B8_9MICO|nr:cupin domain-containing protein [Spelaeicoccus albus]NYI66722.1 mannose-6-phosphate isomerase-like protein (cupin superfamily) [Spelaeicoccus albus]